MSIVSDALEKLAVLQTLDQEINRLKQAVLDIPNRKEAVEDSLTSAKKEFEESRLMSRKLQLELKNKNAELSAAEDAVKKHIAELNTVKSNQAYRALLDEIEEAKKNSSKVEDEILNILDAIEKENKAAAAAAESLKKAEAHAAAETSRLGEDARKFSAELDGKRVEREAVAAGIERVYLSVYERMLSAKGGAALAKLEGDGCGGCHMKLSVQNRNELEKVYCPDSKSLELVRCENCSRILFFPKGSR